MRGKAAGFFLPKGPAGFGAGKAFQASCAGSHRGFTLADATTRRTGSCAEGCSRRTQAGSECSCGFGESG